MERMTKIKNRVGKMNFLVYILLGYFSMISLNSQAETGDNIFNVNCVACHKLSDASMVGPGLKGLTERRDIGWIKEWIKNPQALIDAGDSTAIAVFEEYNKV